MPRLSIHIQGQGSQCCEFAPGPSLMDILQAAWLPMRSGCHNSGACGLCRVRLIKGDAGAPSVAETLHLDSDRLAAGQRLACQMFPQGDLELEILAPARAFEPRPLQPDSARRSALLPSQATPASSTACPRKATDRARLGVAVDLGTTIISLSLCDLDSGARLADCTGANPQAGLGTDVLSRLQAATESAEDRGDLAHLVVSAIGTGIWDMATRACVPVEAIERLALVGNSAMLALLASHGIARQLRPDHWDQPGQALNYDARAWALAWGLNSSARIEILPPLGGFVGSDLLAAALAVGLGSSPAPALLIDFGTNSEIALWDGERLHVTAAAGGPAFEGSGISCGWPAERGAIAHVRQQGDGLACEVIGGGEARGLCGSGLVDLIATLVRTHQLSALGRLACAEPAVDARLRASLRLTKADVDSFQRAKAAIGAGIAALLDSSDLSVASLEKLWLAGAFGSALDLENARAIGLLPPLPDERCLFASHAALNGCERTLVDSKATTQVDQLRRRVRLVNLANYADFEGAFMEHLYLRPQAHARAMPS